MDEFLRKITETPNLFQGKTASVLAFKMMIFLKILKEETNKGECDRRIANFRFPFLIL